MNQSEMQPFKEILLQLRRELTGNLDQVLKPGANSTAKEASGDHSSYSFHIADMGSDTMEREQSFIAVQRSGLTLQQVDEALERIEKGTYGQCLECGCVIPSERLEFIPQAEFCIKCQAAVEAKRREEAWNDYDDGEGEW